MTITEMLMFLAIVLPCIGLVCAVVHVAVKRLDAYCEKRVREYDAEVAEKEGGDANNT